MNILNILLSNTGEYQENRQIYGFLNIGCVILPLEDSFVQKLSEDGVYMSACIEIMVDIEPRLQL